MTDLRQAAQQALEALIDAANVLSAPMFADAITALKAALEQQQAEPPPEWPLIKNILAVFGLDAISFVAKWQAAQQQAEPVLLECVTCGTVYADGVPPQVPVQEQAEPVAREGFNNWWDGDYDDSENRFEKDSAAYWAWAGWQAAQRPWVGLTDEEITELDMEISGRTMYECVRVIEDKLKEKNDH